MTEGYVGRDRREFLRYEYESPVRYNEIDTAREKNPVSNLIEAVSKNLSASGISFTTRKAPTISSILVLDLDCRTARVCQEIENRALVVKNKILGKVVRIENNENGFFDVGVAFITKTNRVYDFIEDLIK